MGTTPIYAATPRIGRAQLSVANPNRDGSGTLANVFVGGANGSRIDAIEIQATAATTAGMIRFFLYDGTLNTLYREVPVAAVTPSASVPAWWGRVPPPPGLVFLNLIIPSGWTLRASTNNAETFNVHAVPAGDN